MHGRRFLAKWGQSFFPRRAIGNGACGKSVVLYTESQLGQLPFGAPRRSDMIWTRKEALMARLARGEYLDPQTIQIVHTISRCVRRAFLCGQDPVLGKSYEHRRQWIAERLEFLASIFAIDCLTFTIMSNHFHLVLRSRPDIVRGWSDEQVARRWLRLCPLRETPAGDPAEPTDAELAMLLNNPMKIARLRIRLSDISWWMRMTNQKIAQRANREDGCTGHFWGRFRPTCSWMKRRFWASRRRLQEELVSVKPLP